MSYLGNEYTLVEKPALDYLTQILGYDYVEGEKLTPSFGEWESLRDVILTNRFKEALQRLNHWMAEVSLDSTLKYFTNSDALGTSLLAINEKIHKAIVDLEFTVTQTVEGHKKNLTVKLIVYEGLRQDLQIIQKSHSIIAGVFFAVNFTRFIVQIVINQFSINYLALVIFKYNYGLSDFYLARISSNNFRTHVTK